MKSSTSTGMSSNRLPRTMMTIGMSRPRLRMRPISEAVLPSMPFLPQSTTMQPMAASVCTAISASSTRRALARPESPCFDRGDDLGDAHAFKIVGVEIRGREQEGEALEIVHRSVARRHRRPCGRPWRQRFSLAVSAAASSES